MTAASKPVVVKDPEWLKVVRQMPCWGIGKQGHVCGDTIGKGPSEASHLDGKSRDDRALPQCGRLHRTEPTSWHHGQETFCRHYGITKEQLVAEAETLYREYYAAQEA